jgi:hypothetical protein
MAQDQHEKERRAEQGRHKAGGDLDGGKNSAANEIGKRNQKRSGCR